MTQGNAGIRNGLKELTYDIQGMLTAGGMTTAGAVGRGDFWEK